MTTSTGPTSPPARRPRRRNCAPPTRAWPPPWSPSSPTTPDAFTPPSGGCSLNGATRWASAPCWRNPSPWPATWPPAPTPAPASPHAARHQRHYQGARVGEARIAVSGPRCACRFRGMGPAPFEALAPGRRPHRRQPRKGGRGFETAEQPPSAPVSTWPWWLSVLSDVRLRRSEAASLTLWRRAALGRRQRPHTVVRSKTDVEAAGAAVAITPAAMEALGAIRPAGVDGREKVFGLLESQIARRVKAIAKAVGLAGWEFFSGHSGRVGMARRMAQNGAPTHGIERQGRWKQGGGMVGRYARGETAGSALRYL